MGRLSKPIVSDDSLIRGLVLDSRDIFSKDKYEERLDVELANFVYDFRKTKQIDTIKLKELVEGFIIDVEKSLKELEDAKLRAEKEEIRKIDKIRSLLVEGSRINSRKLKKELEEFGDRLKSNTLSILRYNRRSERRLRREKAPFGFVLKKLRQDKYLDAEVMQKGFKLGEDTSKEPQIFSEINYLINALNRNPNEKTFAQLKERVSKLTENYKKDLDDFLTIEVDIGINEARKLHRIDHYITFLEMIRKNSNFDGLNELINRLKNLKKKVEYWVYQDTINAKNLERYAIKSLDYGQALLKSSEATEDEHFPGIVTQNIRLYGIVPAIYIFNKDRPRPNRALVLAHQAFSQKESLITLGKRLATQGYVVVSIDLPQHGESRELLRFGNNCKSILTAVRFLRSYLGVTYVGAVGLSLGSMSILLTLCGYNTEVEDRFFKTSDNLFKNLEQVFGIYNKVINKKKWNKKEYTKFLYYTSKSTEYYKELKEIILLGLKNMYDSNSKIDAVVLLSSPLSVQTCVHPYLISFPGHPII